MRVIVTGANGMLGTALCPELKKNGFEVSATDVYAEAEKMDKLDIRDLSAVRQYIKNKSPDIIFHLAAETDVDRCELEADHAFITNTLGTENIALCCQENNIVMVYISTCGVFRGDKAAPYNEFDQPDPVSVYAKSKYQGEVAVRRLLCRYFIFRAGWMIGGGKKDKKFVAKIVELLKTKNTLTVVNDKKGCPTFTRDFSQGIIKIIKTARYGLYHVTNEGSATRHAIACKIVEFLGKKNIVIKPVSSDAFPLPAPRPDSEVVDNFKIRLLGIRMRPWETVLKEYLAELEKDE